MNAKMTMIVHALERLELIFDAIVPSNLQYSYNQRLLYKSPQDHEETFAYQLLMFPERTLCLQGAVPSDNISERYKEYFQNWLGLMYITCVRNLQFDQMSEISIAFIPVDNPVELKLSQIEIRPCAQKLGLFKLIICQLLKVCQHRKISLVIPAPVPETLRALQSMFGSQGLYTDRRYIVHIDVFRSMPDEAILSICRVYGRAKFDADGKILQFNPDILPSASDINDQRVVDARFA